MRLYAEKQGWVPANAELILSWQPIFEALQKVRDARTSIVQHAIIKGKSPATFADADLQCWGETMIRRGRRYTSVRGAKASFRRAVVNAGLEHLLPNLNLHPHRSEYGIRTCDMPEPLRGEMLELLKWKQQKFAPGRPKRGRLRPGSAELLENCIRRLFGFARDIAGYSKIATLVDLLNEEVLLAFVNWSLNERNVTSKFILHFSMVHAAVRHHPKYKQRDWGWLGNFLNELPEDSASERHQRKAQKCLPYDVLCTVPDRIKAIRERTAADQTRASWLVHDELLIRFFLTLAWRQRNVRECRLGTPEEDNLFFAGVPQMIHVARPAWMDEALAHDPQQCFWQFFFREDETKIGRSVRGFLPRTLVPLLGDYIQNHRPKLVGPTGTKTLFVNRDGGPLDIGAMSQMVSELVLKHAGKWVTPHRFRDSFAYAWLEVHPRDYLTLSKILWHQTIETTLRDYGAQFDESNGICAADEWLSRFPSKS